MTYRVFVNVNRGIMDSTAVCVFPWEVLLLEEIHGEQAQMTNPEEMSAIRGARSIKAIKMPYNEEADPVLPLKEELIARQRVAPGDDPLHDPASEYERLVSLYGMDKELPMPVVKKVYGSPSQFAQSVKIFRKGSLPPANIDDLIHGVTEDGDDEEDLESAAPEALSLNQLRKRLKEMGVPVPNRAKRDDLVEILVEKMAA